MSNILITIPMRNPVLILTSIGNMLSFQTQQVMAFFSWDDGDFLTTGLSGLDVSARHFERIMPSSNNETISGNRRRIIIRRSGISRSAPLHHLISLTCITTHFLEIHTSKHLILQPHISSGGLSAYQHGIL
jgi:hypothetical protein